MHELLKLLSWCLLSNILSINAALKAGISIIRHFEGVLKSNDTLINFILGLIWKVHLRRILIVQSVHLIVMESCLIDRSICLSKFKQLVLAAILSLLKC